MIYLILTVLFSLGLGIVFKIIDHRETEIFPVLFINYIVALGVSFFSIESTSTGEYPIIFYGMAVIVGVIFVSTYTLLHKVMSKLGISLSVSLSRLSAVLPTLGSIFIFKETLRPIQIPGIILAFAALPLAAEEIPGKENLKKLVKGGLGWGLLLFFIFGINDFMFKVKGELLEGSDSNFFLTIVFTLDLFITLTIIIVNRIRIRKFSIIMGILLGIVNSRSAYFIIKTLEVLPGSRVYPILGVSVIILSAIISSIVWKEKIRKHNYIFLFLALLAVWMLN